MRSARSNSSPLVAHVLPYPSLGGTEYATRRIMQAVSPHGIRNVAICLFETDELRKFFEAGDCTVMGWDPPEPSITRGARFLSASRALAAEFKRQGVDLVHCAEYLAAHHVALAGRLAGLPVLCHVRNRHDGISRRDQLFLRPVDHFAFVSKDTWNRFSYSVAESDGSVVYDGIQPPAEDVVASGEEQNRAVKAEFDLPADTRLIGSLARVAPQKDYTTLVRAAAKVVQAHPEARFMVVGDCSATEASRMHFAYVQQLLADAGLTKHFIFTGYRSDSMRLLSAFDIVALSTHQEGLPLALVEAMAYAKPIVSTNVDGIPELIADGVNGFLTPHSDADAFAARLIQLLDQPQAAAQFGRAARETVLNGFTADHFSRGMMNLYSRLLK